MLSFSDQYVLLAVVGSFLFGYQVAVFNTTLTFFTIHFRTCGDGFTVNCPAALKNESLAGAMVFLGAAAGSLAAGKMVSSGRRTAILACHVISLLGSLVCFFATGFPTLIFGRLITGFCVGLITVASPTFINEMCPSSTRGSRGALHQIGIVVGVFVAIVLGLTLPPLPTAELLSAQSVLIPRVMLLAPGVISTVCMIVMLTVLHHDTPLSLLEHGKSKAASTVLFRIYHRDPGLAEERFDDLTQAMSESKSDSKGPGISGVFSQPVYRRIFIIGCLLAVSQQVSGINAFVTMSNKVFITAGLEPSAASRASAIMAAVNVVMTFPSVLLVDRVGRKALLIFGMLVLNVVPDVNVTSSGTSGQTVSLAIVPVLYCVGLREKIAIGSVISVIGFFVFFALGQGPVIWICLFEMFPAEIKGVASGTASSLNWLAGVTVVYLNSLYGTESFVICKFTIFTVLCAATLLFIIFFIKETKGSVRSPYLPVGENAGESRPLKDLE